MQHQSYRVTGLEWFGTDVFEIAFRRDGLAFVPGDCVAVFAADGRTSRPYSIASGTAEDDLRLLIRRMPGGAVSAWLADRKPGDTVLLSPPFGWFRPGDPALEGPHVFVATGTGLAPFVSHLRSRPDAPRSPLLYGISTADDAAHVDWLRERTDLHWCVSREEVDGSHHGRVTDLLESIDPGPHAHWFLCGLDAMIDETTRRLEARGCPITHIHRECFFNVQPV